MRHTKEAASTRSGGARPGPNGSGNLVAAASSSVRLLPVSAKVELALSREIDEYAKAHGITRSRATGHYLAIARETLRSREGVAAGKAEEILETLEGVRTVVTSYSPSCARSRPSGTAGAEGEAPLPVLRSMTPCRARTQRTLRARGHRVRHFPRIFTAAACMAPIRFASRAFSAGEASGPLARGPALIDRSSSGSASRAAGPILPRPATTVSRTAMAVPLSRSAEAR